MSDTVTIKFVGCARAINDIAPLFGSRLADRKTIWHFRSRAVLAAVGAGSLALILSLLFSTVFVGAAYHPMIPLGGIVTGIVLWSCYTWREHKRFFAGVRSSSPVFAGDQEWVFDDTGVLMKSCVSECHFRWSAFDGVLYNDLAIGLTSGSVYFALPLTTETQSTNLTERIKAWGGFK